MKGTEHFKDVIQNYLETRASYDELFAENFRKESKNIDECITYILTEVQRMECAGLSDDEVYSLAVHYYDEDNIEVGKSINCQVVVNHTIELTEEEKAEARQKAIQKYQDEELRKLQNRNRPAAENDNRATQSGETPQTSRQETQSGKAGGTADSPTFTIRVLTP